MWKLHRKLTFPNISRLAAIYTWVPTFNTCYRIALRNRYYIIPRKNKTTWEHTLADLIKWEFQSCNIKLYNISNFVQIEIIYHFACLIVNIFDWNTFYFELTNGDESVWMLYVVYICKTCVHTSIVVLISSFFYENVTFNMDLNLNAPFPI